MSFVPLTRVTLARVRQLRRNATPAAHRLWAALRRRGVDGWRFRRQHPIGDYVVDFYCPAARLAVELDGRQHALDAARAYDDERARVLASHGIRVVRFTNADVIERLTFVVESISSACVASGRERRR